MVDGMAMTEDEQTRLRARTAGIVPFWAMAKTPALTGDRKDDFPALISAANVVAEEARLALHRWIEAARRSGMSWSEVGEVLGISKQAAQQRFRSPGDPGAEAAAAGGDDGIEHVRIGATAFNELAILEAEGRKGMELLRTGALHLVFRRTGQCWEYCRTLGRAPEGGWTHVSTWFPFHYYKRAIG
ncbi:hypothetical protein GVO57_07955 [Sphingomonas changnyeongensis]|uniref:Uncharacterized protein n=2 Tax=Sphingomonas changnyeongensis TaxID=2698679 RepID=A0A7Z2S562_9SPHN|nr:hypothetical protein GVO57_07955 [Sphingomonas changnyeongensis]